MGRYAGIVFAVLIGLATLGLVGAAERAAAAPAAGAVGDGTPGSCTDAELRARMAGGGSVTFICGATLTTITVASVITVSQPTTLTGGGLVEISGAWQTRIFFVEAGASLALHGMRLGWGDSTSTASNGGAIASHGALHIEDSRIYRGYAANGDSGGAIFASGPLTIINSQFISNTAGGGGAIYITGPQARARIVDSLFEGNYASNTSVGRGGAIWVGQWAHLVLEGSQINKNEARNGGGLYLSQDAVVTLTASAQGNRVYVVDNRAVRDGGGIYNEAGRLSLTDTSLSSNRVSINTAGIGYGGAIASYGPVTMTRTLIDNNLGRIGAGAHISSLSVPLHAGIDRTHFIGNAASIAGGGLYADGAGVAISLTNSTFGFNAAVTQGGGLGRHNARVHILRSSFLANSADLGGGIWSGADKSGNQYVGLVSLNTSTVAQNTALGGTGGGIATYGEMGILHSTIVHNTSGVFIIAGGARPIIGGSVLHNPGGLNCDGAGADPITYGNNFSSDNSCQFTDFLDQQGNGLDPLLGPLAFAASTNRTYYFAPLAGSPLINKGMNGICPAHDQILAARNGLCDIGAAEHGGLLPRLFMPYLQR